jgi:hypothetical protein
MHPDGSMGLVFNYGDTLELGDNSSQTIILDTVSPQSQQLKLAGSIEAFGILFRPVVLFPSLAFPSMNLPAQMLCCLLCQPYVCRSCICSCMKRPLWQIR